eukprot:1147400-Pelagomonas_calceolata.AAC.5
MGVYAQCGNTHLYCMTRTACWDTPQFQMGVNAQCELGSSWGRRWCNGAPRCIHHKFMSCKERVSGVSPLRSSLGAKFVRKACVPEAVGSRMEPKLCRQVPLFCYTGRKGRPVLLNRKVEEGLFCYTRGCHCGTWPPSFGLVECVMLSRSSQPGRSWWPTVWGGGWGGERGVY